MFQCDLAEPCDPNVRCDNLQPGYRCGPCPYGYTGGQSISGVGLEYAVRNRQRCHDINECEDSNICPSHSQCTNTQVKIISFKLARAYWKIKILIM